MKSRGCTMSDLCSWNTMKWIAALIIFSMAPNAQGDESNYRGYYFSFDHSALAKGIATKHEDDTESGISQDELDRLSFQDRGLRAAVIEAGDFLKFTRVDFFIAKKIRDGFVSAELTFDPPYSEREGAVFFITCGTKKSSQEIESRFTQVSANKMPPDRAQQLAKNLRERLGIPDKKAAMGDLAWRIEANSACFEDGTCFTNVSDKEDEPNFVVQKGELVSWLGYQKPVATVLFDGELLLSATGCRPDTDACDWAVIHCRKDGFVSVPAHHFEDL